MGQMTPRAAQKRDQILTAARRLFLQHGFSGASTDAIRAEAGVSKETLYRYYASKEDLFADVLRQLTLEHMSKQLTVDAGPSPRENPQALRAAALALTEELVSVMMQPDYLALYRIIISETPRFPHLGQLFRTTVPEQSLKLIGELLQQLRTQGLVGEIDDEAAGRALVGSILTYAIEHLLNPDGTPPTLPPGRLMATVDLFVRAISAPTTSQQ